MFSDQKRRFDEIDFRRSKVGFCGNLLGRFLLFLRSTNSANPKGNPVGEARDSGISGFRIKKHTSRAREKVVRGLASACDTCSATDHTRGSKQAKKQNIYLF